MTDFKGVTKRDLIKALIKLFNSDKDKDNLLVQQESVLAKQQSLVNEFKEYYGMTPRQVLIKHKIEDLEKLVDSCKEDIERLQAEAELED